MKEINPYLKEVEKFLVDLPILERNKIISDLNSELAENPEMLKQAPLNTANNKRVEAGFKNFQVKNSGSSFGKIIFKTFAFMFVCFLIFLGFLIWKFTPLFEIDEENQRVTILGGLIDIDGKAGRFIISDEVHFTASNYTNDLTGSIAKENARKVTLLFESGKFDIETNANAELTFDCKLSDQPADNMIKQVGDSVTLNFKELAGSNCTLAIPERSQIKAIGNTAAFDINKPFFDLDLELETGNVILNLSENRSYTLDLDAATGNVDQFESYSSNNGEFNIKIKLDTGSISR